MLKYPLTTGILKINLEEYPVINQLIILGEPKERIVEELKKIIFQNQMTLLFKVIYLKM